MVDEASVRTAPKVKGPDRAVRRLVVLLLLAGLPLVAFEALSIAQLRASREAEIRQETSRLLDLVEAEQTRLVEDIRHVLVALVEMGLGQMAAQPCLSALDRIKQRYPRYLAISASDAAGTIWCSTEAAAVGISVADRAYRDEALGTGEIVTGRYMVSRTTGRPAIPFALAYPGPDGGRAGVLTVLLDTGWLEDFLGGGILPAGSSVVVADRSGTTLSRVPDMPGLQGRALPDRYQPLLRAEGKGVVEIDGLDGTPRLVAYSPVGGGIPDLYVHVSVDKAAAMRAVNATALRSTLTFAMLLLMAGLGAAWGVRRFLMIRQEVEQGASRMAAVLASTVDGVVEMDRDWRFTYLNDRARELVAEGRELVGMTLWEAFPELVETPVWEKAHLAMAERVPAEAEVQGPRTGRWFWMRAFPSPSGLAVYLLDVSARKAAEEDLRESKERLTLALQSAEAGTFEWDLQTGRGHWSAESYRIFGLDPDGEGPSARTWLSVVHPEDREAAAMAGRLQVQDVQGPHFRLDYRIVRRDGSVRWVSSIGRVAHDADGRPQRVSGLNMDVTERKSMEQDLREAKARAEEASLSKSRFLAAASHDLRQPLQSALLFAGVLHRHVEGGQAGESLAALERALATLKDLLDGLLDVSRLDSGAVLPDLADFPLGPLLDDIGDAYAPVAEGKGLDFSVDASCRAAAVRSDRLLLGRMLRNLVENAIRYTERGHVRIACEAGEDEVRIEVHDSGIGIPAEHLGTVFEEFHQVGNPGRDRNQGLGLGLAIVRRLSALLGHPVAVRSTPGSGSTFRVAIRRAAMPAEALPAQHQAIEASGEGRLAVLVDDDEIVLSGLAEILREWCFDVVAARSPDEALAGLGAAGRPPDLVIADYRLGGGEVGTEAVARIRKHVGLAVPGIVLTGEIGPACERDAATLGLEVVHKPTTPRRLHDAVQRLLVAAPGRHAG
jgi:PAS domain S-box-containing protein